MSFSEWTKTFPTLFAVLLTDWLTDDQYLHFPVVSISALESESQEYVADLQPVSVKFTDWEVVSIFFLFLYKQN